MQGVTKTGRLLMSPRGSAVSAKAPGGRSLTSSETASAWHELPCTTTSWWKSHRTIVKEDTIHR